ncbi:MAG: hypothetical protein EAX95_14620 [Candidatus Thorarchaeota archaeon]|nr:hypothetical protein [Candidatus Thorarchaeota archaeon]
MRSRMAPKKKKPSLIVRACGVIIAIVCLATSVWFGLTAQQLGQDLMMYVAFGIAALCFLLCVGIAAGKVTPTTYMGTFGN